VKGLTESYGDDLAKGALDTDPEETDDDPADPGTLRPPGAE
jgi:hypothetical protein